MNKEFKISPEEYQKLKEELKEAKAILYIKVEARTKELRELAASLEQKVKERTSELEKRTQELEGSKIALTNMLEDVNKARVLAEGERDKTKAIITNFTDGLLVLDKENRITLINSEGERLLDIKAKEAEGRGIRILAGKPHLKKLAKLVSAKGGKGLFREELFFEKPREQALEVTTISLASREEMVIILHDVSRERLIERMKTEFVSLAAHQLRTPLSAIKWTLRMLLDGDLGEITKEQGEFIEKTYRSNERMITLINDLLDVTRIEEGRYLYKPVLTDLRDVVQFVINSYQGEIKRKKLILEFKKPEEKIPKIKLDVEKIRLAIQNILDNAIRYTKTGGKVTISLNYVKKKIELSIKDTGIGVSEDQKDRIFTKFFRAANVIRMETEGSGLGLFIAKNIIEAHGGKIWFESEENKGTTFYITLPVEKEFEEFLKEF